MKWVWKLPLCFLVILMVSGPNFYGKARAMLPGFGAPSLRGTYIPVGKHPFVFSDESDLRSYVESADPILTKSRQRVAALTTAALGKIDAYATPYAGCDVGEYLARLTRQGAAADAASLLASYAYLHTLDARFGTAAEAAEAAKGAKRILLQWAVGGFGGNGQLLTDFHRFCDAKGMANPAAWTTIALQIGRGVPSWVNAQDLLLAAGSLNGHDAAALDHFLDQQYELIRAASNYRVQYRGPDCEKFNNQATAHVEALLEIARLRNDKVRFEAAADGRGGSVLVPWSLQMQENIYGPNEKPLPCYTGTPDPHVYAQTDQPQAGEIVDRYRAKDDQPFVYSIGSLRGLLTTAQILQQAGFNAFGFVGHGGQSLRSPLDFYGAFLTRFMSMSRVIVPPGSAPISDYQQYVGHTLIHGSGVTVSGADSLLVPFLLGLKAYPNDASIRGVILAATRTGAGNSFYAVDARYISLLPRLEALAVAH